MSSSETWTWLHSPVFRATPLDMKAEADLHFLQGINQLVATAGRIRRPQAGEPGWHFYAAAVFNDHNPWWLVMPDVTRYLQRVSLLAAAGPAGQRRGPVSAYRRRLRGIHAWATPRSTGHGTGCWDPKWWGKSWTQDTTSTSSTMAPSRTAAFLTVF